MSLRLRTRRQLALLLIPASVLFALACEQRTPFEPSARSPGTSTAFLNKSSYSEIGCATFNVALAGAHGVTVTPVVTGVCGAVEVVVDSVPSFDSAKDVSAYHSRCRMEALIS